MGNPSSHRRVEQLTKRVTLQVDRAPRFVTGRHVIGLFHVLAADSHSFLSSGNGFQLKRTVRPSEPWTSGDGHRACPID